MTCNYANKILPAIHSRIQTLHFDSLDYSDYSVRVGEILVKENIKFDIEVLEYFISSSYPDLRKCIGLVQQYSTSGELKIPSESISSDSDYLIDMVRLFKEGKVSEARKIVVSQTTPEEYEQVFRYLYENLEMFGSSDEIQNDAILVIAKGLRNHTLSADPEINLAATFIELSNIGK